MRIVAVEVDAQVVLWAENCVPSARRLRGSRAGSGLRDRGPFERAIAAGHRPEGRGARGDRAAAGEGGEDVIDSFAEFSISGKQGWHSATARSTSGERTMRKGEPSSYVTLSVPAFITRIQCRVRP